MSQGAALMIGQTFLVVAQHLEDGFDFFFSVDGLGIENAHDRIRAAGWMKSGGGNSAGRDHKTTDISVQTGDCGNPGTAAHAPDRHPTLSARFAAIVFAKPSATTTDSMRIEWPS